MQVKYKLLALAIATLMITACEQKAPKPEETKSTQVQEVKAETEKPSTEGTEVKAEATPAKTEEVKAEGAVQAEEKK